MPVFFLWLGFDTTGLLKIHPMRGGGGRRGGVVPAFFLSLRFATTGLLKIHPTRWWPFTTSLSNLSACVHFHHQQFAWICTTFAKGDTTGFRNSPILIHGAEGGGGGGRLSSILPTGSTGLGWSGIPEEKIYNCDSRLVTNSIGACSVEPVRFGRLGGGPRLELRSGLASSPTCQ